MGKVYDYFNKISPDLLPLGATERENPIISVAEAMFGVVEIVDKNASQETDDAIAIASRLTFSDARLNQQELPSVMPEISLNILGSPKRNSCNMYFHPDEYTEGYVKQGELNIEYHQVNGRKFYLHATAKTIQNESWEYKKGRNKRDNLRPRCRPFANGQTFVFHVDFENLNEQELGVLLTSLRPKEDFRHKLGMGKPLGLGSVRIDIEGVFEIDRKQRYGVNALEQERFKSITKDNNSQESDHWKQYYIAESNAWNDKKKK